MLNQDHDGSFVYFLEAIGENLIKIGFTSNLRRRLANIRSMLPWETELLGVIRGESLQERTIHIRFASFHVRAEWFQNSDEIREFIAQNCFLPLLPEYRGREKGDLLNADLEQKRTMYIQIVLDTETHTEFRKVARQHEQSILARLRYLVRRDIEQARRNEPVSA